MLRRSYVFAALVAPLPLAACGGGTVPAPLAVADAPRHRTATAQIAITVPIATALPFGSGRPASARRTPRYVSPATASVLVYVNGAKSPTVLPLPAGTAGAGGTTYGVTLGAPVGTDTFVVSLIAKNGALLATASATANVTPAGPNAIDVVASGAPATAPYTVASLTAAANGRPTTIGLGAAVYDAAGYAISGTFTSPIRVQQFTLGNPQQFGMLSAGSTQPTTLGAATTYASASDAASSVLLYDGVSTSPIRVYATTPDARITGAAVIRPGAVQLGRGLYVVTGAPDNGLYRVDTSTYAATRTSVTLPATPRSIRTSPDGKYLLIGLANGSVAVYDATSLAALVTLAPRGTPVAPSVVDMTVDDRALTLYVLVAQGEGTYAVDSTLLASGGATGAHYPLPGGATACGSVAVDVANQGIGVSCTDGLYGYSAAVAGAASFTRVTPGAGGAIVVQSLPPFQTLAANPLGGIGVYTAVAGGTTYAASLTRTIANPAGSNALALDSTSQTVYAGTATTVELYDATAFPPTTASLGSIAVGSPPLQIASIPGGNGRPDSQLLVVTTAGSVVALDPVALTTLKTTTFAGAAVAEAFAP